MSSAQILVLGAIAGSTILIGLPLGRVAEPEPEREGRAERDRDRDPALPALRRHPRRDRAGGRGARKRGRRRQLVAFRLVCAALRRRRDHRADEPRLLRRLDEAEARRGDARARRGVRGRVRAELGGVALRVGLALAADRDRDRVAQLLRGPRDRAGRRAGRDQPRRRPDHRLRPAQRDRGLRDRRADVRRHGQAGLAVPAAARPDRRRPDLRRHADRAGLVERGALDHLPRARGRVDPLRRHRS